MDHPRLQMRVEVDLLLDLQLQFLRVAEEEVDVDHIHQDKIQTLEVRDHQEDRVVVEEEDSKTHLHLTMDQEVVMQGDTIHLKETQEEQETLTLQPVVAVAVATVLQVLEEKTQVLMVETV